MSRLTAYEHDPGYGSEMRRVLRSVSEMDGLLILLSLLYLFVSRDRIAHPVHYMAAIAVYGALVLVLRYAPPFARFHREKLVVAATAMVFFITGLLAAAGGDRGPLLNLYLLPIVTSALTLGRGPTLLVVVLVLAGRVGLSHLAGGPGALSPGHGLALVTDAVPVLLVALLTSMLASDIRDIRERLQAKSDQDEVTGLLNLQAFTRLLEEEIARAGRRGSGFALMLVDIDGLKAVNERFGTEAGHRALAAVAQALKRSTRSADLIARYGGDEFVMFLSGSGPSIARAVANRVRHNVATTTLEFGGSLHRVTVGIGAAVFPADGRDLRDLIKVADRAVRKDKDSRRPVERNEARPAGLTGTLDF